MVFIQHAFIISLVGNKRFGIPIMKNNLIQKFESMPTRKKLGWILIPLGALLAYGVCTHNSTFFELNRGFIILFLLWLAWPELEALPRFIVTLTPICAIVCAWRPQYLIVVVPLFILYLVLRPPAKRKNKNNNKDKRI
mgnify:CR=1 FL=1